MSGGLVSAIVGRIADFVLQKVQPILKPLYYRAINKRFKMQLRLVLCFNLPDDALELIARAIATLADVLAKWRKVRHMTSTRTNLQVTYEDFQAPILVRITPSPTSPGRIDELEAVIELLGTLDLRYNEPVEIATYIDTLNLVRDELAKAFGVPGYQNYSAILIRKV